MAKQIPVTAAALKLGITYHKCRALLLSGELLGGRDEFGRLFVDSRAVERAKRVGKARGDGLTRRPVR
jgi:hypothetical protein